MDLVKFLFIANRSNFLQTFTYKKKSTEVISRLKFCMRSQLGNLL